MGLTRSISKRIRFGNRRFQRPNSAPSPTQTMWLAQRYIPVFVNTGYDLSLEQTWSMLTAYLNLTVVLAYDNCWLSDRLLRPFLERFPRFYLSLAQQFTQDGIESLVAFCGAERLLFGSDFPTAYMGAQVMNVLRAEIPEADKVLIASGNMERLLREADYQ